MDGDSLWVRISNRKREVRLYGVDAPERGQPGADDARNALRRMLGAQWFWVEHQHDDRYGRMISIIYFEGRNHRASVNLRMIREGYAYAYTCYGGRELGFHRAESNARQRRLGVWRNSRRGEERPWEYRRSFRPAREEDPMTMILGISVIGIALLASFIAFIVSC